MKKSILLVAVLLSALFIAGCASAPAGQSSNEMMSSAKNNAPDGSLIGQGTAKEKDKDASMKKAESNARFQLVRAMSYIVKELVDDAVSAGRLTTGVAEDFRQSINTALTRSILGNAVKQDSGFGADNTAWVVFYLSKGDTLKEINNAVNAAKELHAAGPFNTNGFDAKFDAAIAREWKN